MQTQLLIFVLLSDFSTQIVLTPTCFGLYVATIRLYNFLSYSKLQGFCLCQRGLVHIYKFIVTTVITTNNSYYCCYY